VYGEFCRARLWYFSFIEGSIDDTNGMPMAFASHSCGYTERMSGRDDVRPAVSSLKLTYDDFRLFLDDGKRHELIDGEHYVTPCPFTKHQRLVGNLLWLIRSFLESHPIGEVFVAPFDVVFSDFDVVAPDLLYMSEARAAEVLTAKNVVGAPELVIEISSKGTRKRDETIKRRLYERFAVSEYWIVDPEIDTIRVFRLSRREYGRVIELSREASDVLATPLLPGLEMPLAKIFKEP
jgi:Uma2 family endonuclease